MANQEQLALLQRSTADWNAWRGERENDFDIDLSEADLSFADLVGANLSYANLRGTNLVGTDFRATDLSYANLSDANLDSADLTEANLSYANLNNANVGYTLFAKVDLRTIKGLSTVNHRGPSTIGADTLMLSEGDIPEIFLRGAGLSNTFIEYVRSLVGKRIEYYSCFISYSSKDQEFVERLYTDLQSKGVRCWFAPEDLKTGDKIRDRIDQSIGAHDKLLLVLSQHSVNSSWVEFEVEAALAKESSRNTLMLFPVRLDNAVKESQTSWAGHIRRTRNITDFSEWKQPDDYQRVLNRLLRDLQPETPPIAQ